MKFAHLGDCHLGGWRQPELKELNFRSFQIALERIAKEKNIIPQDFSWAKSKGKTDQISAITGEAPLFIDQINLKQITELMAVAWTEIGSFSTFYLVKKVLQKIRSPGEIYHYSKLGFPIILKKFRNAIFKQSRT